MMSMLESMHAAITHELSHVYHELHDERAGSRKPFSGSQETGARAWTGLDHETMEKQGRGKRKIKERPEGFGGKGARKRVSQGGRVS